MFEYSTLAPLVRLRIIASKSTDLRLKMVDELVSGIRVIKAYAWESAIMKKIVRERGVEVKKYLKLLSLKAVVYGVTRYTGMIIFLPIAIILVLHFDGLNARDSYAIYSLLLLIGLQTIMLFFFGMQSFA